MYPGPALLHQLGGGQALEDKSTAFELAEVAVISAVAEVAGADDVRFFIALWVALG
ncbi:hypothetical protein D3C72_2508290 [compost metagenome]